MSNHDNLAASADDDTLGLWLRGLRVQSPSFTQGSEFTEEVARFVAHFWSKVDRDNGPMHPTLGRCWRWTGARAARGYGRFTFQSGAFVFKVAAHRYAYELANGPIPAGLEIRHRCDRTSCCRPDHLLTGTHAQNMADMAERRRSRLGERNINAVLTDRAVVELRFGRTGERSHEALARQFGVVRATISNAVSGRTWRHLPLSGRPLFVNGRFRGAGGLAYHAASCIRCDEAKSMRLAPEALCQGGRILLSDAQAPAAGATP